MVGQHLNFRQRSVAVRWLFSYALMLIIPLVLSGAVYLRTANTLQHEINRANTALLQQVKNDMDNKLSDMQRLSVQIGLNARVRELVRTDSSTLSAQDYNAMMQDFRVYRLANSTVENFCIFLQQHNAVLTPSTMMTGTVYDDFLDNEFSLLDGTPLRELLWQRDVHGFFPISQRQYGSSGKELIAYLQALPVDRTGTASASLLVLLDSAQLTKTLANINWIDSGVVLVMDAQNNILACTQPNYTLPAALDYNSLIDEGERFFYTEDDMPHAVAYASSDVTELKYLSILPSSVFWKKANEVRSFTIIAVLCSLVLGGALAWLLVRRNYLPVSKLVHELANRAGTDRLPSQSEFVFIQSAFDTALGNRHAVDEVKDRHMVHLRRSFISRLLRDNLDMTIPIGEALGLYDIQFATDDFCTLLFFIKQIDGEVLKGAQQDEYTLARYIIRNVFEELLGADNQAIMITVDDLQALLVNVNDREHFTDSCKAAIAFGQQFIAERFGISLSIATSRIVTGTANIHLAYAEAYTTIEYCILMGREGLTDSDQLACGLGGVNNSYYYYYPLKVEVQLTNMIKSGDYPGAKQILAMLMERNFRQHNPPQTIAKCFMFNLTSTMMKTTYEMAGANGDDLPGVNESIELLLNCTTVSEMEMEMDRLLIRMCEYSLSRAKTNDLVQLTYDYIGLHYSDPGLGVAQLAEQLAITPSYLSKRFRHDIGTSLPDYIVKVRLDATKRLLVDTALPLNTIAERCGFINSNTLIRTFKRTEGITPGKYREINAAQ